MIVFFINVIKIIFLLGFLVLIHEGGHFIAAKLSKVTVNEFAIGFGPIIWQSKNTQTKYCLRLIPLGGFVSMEGEVEKSEKKGSFSKASIWKKIIIVAAGGLVNIGFALVVYLIFTSVQGDFIGTRVDYIMEGYAANSSQILPGDIITKVNNKKVIFKTDISDIVQESNGKEVKLTIKRNDEVFEQKLTPTTTFNNYTGIYLSEADKTRIKAIEKGSPADEYGLKENDVILKVDGKDIESNPYKLLNIISEVNKESATFLVLRDDEEIKVDVTFNKIPSYVLGIGFKVEENTFWNRVKYGLYDTERFIFAIVDNLKQLFTGKASVDQLTGPVGISTMIAETKGVAEYIYYLALISLSLGVTNLLPFPPLDGGKIVLLLIEAITRKPIKENVEVGLQLSGFALLFLLSIYVTYNDILRIF